MKTMKVCVWYRALSIEAAYAVSWPRTKREGPFGFMNRSFFFSFPFFFPLSDRGLSTNGSNSRDLNPMTKLTWVKLTVGMASQGPGSRLFVNWIPVLARKHWRIIQRSGILAKVCRVPFRTDPHQCLHEENTLIMSGQWELPGHPANQTSSTSVAASPCIVIFFI